jgi:hypothetical protein
MLFRRLASDQKNYIVNVVLHEIENYLRNCNILFLDQEDDGFVKIISILIKRSQAHKCLSDYLGSFIRRLLEFKYRNPEMSVSSKFWINYIENIEVNDEHQLEE